MRIPHKLYSNGKKSITQCARFLNNQQWAFRSSDIAKPSTYFLFVVKLPQTQSTVSGLRWTLASKARLSASASKAVAKNYQPR